jgi:hypothetical protein
MRGFIAWLLFLALIAWSGLIGALAGGGAVAVRRRLPDRVSLALAVLLVFGLALAIGGRAVRLSYLLAGALGFGAVGVPFALLREWEAGEERGPDGGAPSSRPRDVFPGERT